MLTQYRKPILQPVVKAALTMHLGSTVILKLMVQSQLENSSKKWHHEKWMFSLGFQDPRNLGPLGDVWRRLWAHLEAPRALPPSRADHSPQNKSQMMESVSDAELFFLRIWEIQRQLLERSHEGQETLEGFLCDSVVKNPPANEGDTGSIPDLGGSHMRQNN